MEKGKGGGETINWRRGSVKRRRIHEKSSRCGAMGDAGRDRNVRKRSQRTKRNHTKIAWKRRIYSRRWWTCWQMDWTLGWS